MYGWVRTHKIEIFFIAIILIIGSFLRLYHVGDWMHFGQDEGRDAFVIADIAQNFHVKLLGPAAPNKSPDFHLGPAYYYLLVPFYWLGGSSPGAGATAVALFAIFSIVLVYFLSRNFFGTVAGIVSASVYAVSYLMLYYGRWAWNPNIVPFFILLFFIALYKMSLSTESPRQEKYLYILALSTGILIQLHGTALMTVPIILVLFFVLYKPRIHWKKYLIAALIFIVCTLPLWIYDITNNFDNTKGLFRIITQSESGVQITFGERIQRTGELFSSFWHESLLHSQLGWFFVGLFAVLLIFLATQFYHGVKNKTKNAPALLMMLWIIVPLFVFIFYKEAIPIHYFAILFPVPFIVLGWFVGWLWKQNILREVLVLSIVVLLVWQGAYAVQLLIDLGPGGSRVSSYQVTLQDMKDVVNFIQQVSIGEPFNFRSEPYGQYNRSYKYLFEQAGCASSYIAVPKTYLVTADDQWELPREYADHVTAQDTFGKARLYTIVLEYF